MSYFAASLQVKLLGKSRRIAAGGLGWPALWLAFVVLATGCASGTADQAPVPRPQVPTPSADVNVNTAWRDAKLVAAREPGRQPAMGAGASMQPVYGSTTMLVINPIAYDQLRAGMSVAYLNRRGVRVVHQLVEKADDGWTVMGLNNEQEDEERVTRQNLIGAIYASFNYDADEPPSKTGSTPARQSSGSPSR